MRLKETLRELLINLLKLKMRFYIFQPVSFLIYYTIQRRNCNF